MVLTYDWIVGEVIKAWDLGVATMKKGELAKLTCRSDYAYGEQGSPPKIPANATLVFEVSLHVPEWRSVSFSQSDTYVMKVFTCASTFKDREIGAYQLNN